MKKIFALILALAMVLSLAACGGKKTEAPAETPAEPEASASASAEASASEEEEVEEEVEAGDMDYVLDNGVLVVGITDFAPMDYKDENGEWIGYDADMARAFAESLGVEVKFEEIEWDNKILELNSKVIDCVWNGMTLTDEVLSAMECTRAYCDNAQVVVMSADKAAQYTDVESMADLTFAVESGSAGKEMAEENSLNFTESTSQAAALMEVAAGTSDAAIIDSLMADAMVGEGTSYADLTSTIALNSEEYGVGFRKGSDLAEALNAFFDLAAQDGTMDDIAATYFKAE